MDAATLLADPEAIRLEKIIQHNSSLTLSVSATRSEAECPRCHRPSTRVHSYYSRQVADLPWHGVAVRLELHTRRFRCKNSLCTKRIFCERLPRVVAHYARKTVRMDQALELIGFLLGGEAGARATAELAMATSADTLLRRVRAAVKPCAPTPRVLGVDDFAFRRGRRYGTILVDLEKHRVEVAEFVSFANGLTADLQAVRAALEHEWSQGQVEGQVHRLKMVKRQMYGRGNLDLLRARVLRAA